MFSSFSLVDAGLKFAEPVTTIGSSPSGSCSRNLQWMKATCWFSPSFAGVGLDHPTAKSGLQLGSGGHVDVVLRIQPDERFGGVLGGPVLLLQQQEAQRSVAGVVFSAALKRSGTVKANVMQARSSASSSSATYNSVDRAARAG